MRKILAVMTLVFAIATLTVACGGGGSKTVKVGDQEINLSDDKPGDFPDDFPEYKGAKIQGSFSGESEGQKGTVVTYLTDDSADDVKAFYEKEFEDGPWKATASGSFSGLGNFAAENGDTAAYVLISETDGKTSIVVTYGSKSDFGIDGDANSSSNDDEATPEGDDSSSSSGGDSKSPTPSPLPDEVDLPDDFPSDRVPLPDGATVTSSSSFGSSGVQTYLIELYTKDTPKEVADYFAAEMPKHGWTNAFNTNSNGEYSVLFSGGDANSGSTEGLTMSAAASDDTPGYTVVTMSVTLTSGEPQ
jgi:hypothetical protein